MWSHTRPACRCTSPPFALGDASPSLELFRLNGLPMALVMREVMEVLLDGDGSSLDTFVNWEIAVSVSPDWA